MSQGKCDGCGEISWLVPLHGDRGGPLRCFMCAGAWNAEHSRKRKWGRIVIKAMKMFLKEGGNYSDLDKLKIEAADLGMTILAGYERADTIGADLPDITSELLADTVRLTHPDQHPVERKALAQRVTQELLALQPFVFPAPKPEPIEEMLKPRARTSSPRDPDDDARKRHYPCELCSDTTPYFYCDTCKAEYEKRNRDEDERRRRRQREQYARRKKMWTPPRDKNAPKLRGPRQSRVAVNQVPGANLINRELSGLQAAILIAAITNRIPGARGCDVSHPELLAEIWKWKPSRDLRWGDDAKKYGNGDLYRAGDTKSGSYIHGAFNHIPRHERRAARASLSRAITRLHERQLVDFVWGTGCYSGGMVLTPHGEQIARQLVATAPDDQRRARASGETTQGRASGPLGAVHAAAEGGTP